MRHKAPKTLKPKTVNPDIAASRFLERWIHEEAPLHAALQCGSPSAQRSAIGRTVSHFGVVRVLKRSSEQVLGVPRLDPVRERLAAITGQDTTDTIRKVSQQEMVATTYERLIRSAGKAGGQEPEVAAPGSGQQPSPIRTRLKQLQSAVTAIRFERRGPFPLLRVNAKKWPIL